MPSSISNSDVAYREVPDQPWSKLVAAALILVIAAMTWWEAFSRSMEHIPGTYQDFGEMWAMERRKLDRPNDIRVILAGSSRILWAADLDILEGQIGSRPLQLALPGTGPALIVEDIVENTEFDGLIFVGVTPFLFNRLDEGFFGGVAFDRHRNQSPSQWSGSRIHRFLSDYFAFLDESFDLFALADRYSDFSDRPGTENLKEGGWKLGNHYADFQTDMWAPVERVGSFDNTQVTNFWTPGMRRSPETPEKMAELAESAIAFFAPLVEKLRERGGDMVFIRMPSDGLYLEHDLKTNHKELLWQPMADGLGATAINSFDYPQLSTELDIPEWSHLSRDSQDRWSRDVVPVIEARYLEYRGHSIYEVIGGDGK